MVKSATAWRAHFPSMNSPESAATLSSESLTLSSSGATLNNTLDRVTMMLTSCARQKRSTK
eukprot:1312958-Pyramimonas_sp.AAC.1